MVYKVTKANSAHRVRRDLFPDRKVLKDTGDNQVSQVYPEIVVTKATKAPKEPQYEVHKVRSVWPVWKGLKVHKETRVSSETKVSRVTQVSRASKDHKVHKAPEPKDPKVTMDLQVECRAPKAIQVSEVHRGHRVLPASRVREEHKVFKVILVHKDHKVTKEIKVPLGPKAIQEHRVFKVSQAVQETPVAKVHKVTRETEALVSSSPRSTTQTPRGHQRQVETFQGTVSSASWPEPYRPTIRTTVNYTSTPPQVVGHSRLTCRCQVTRGCPVHKVTKV